MVPLLAGILLAGCAQTTHGTLTAEPIPVPEAGRPIDQLAKSMGLKIVEIRPKLIKLENPENRVYIFTGPRGQAYVNGKKVGLRGSVRPIRGVYTLPTAMERSIRLALKAPQAYAAARAVPQGKTHRVVIDPGHGGKDPGATSVLGFYEKSINLSVANELAELLRWAGLAVKMTRSSDVFLPLDARAEIANRWGADLFVSLHADSCGTPSVQGFTVYVCRSASPQSQSAARAVEKALGGQGLKNRGVRGADYRVLVKNTCPAILVELGYLSNREEAARLADPEFRNQMARWLAQGILGHLKAGRFTL
jgi:N-acetylmuramoyl-L-alanine amidase